MLHAPPHPGPYILELPPCKTEAVTLDLAEDPSEMFVYRYLELSARREFLRLAR